MRSDKGNALFLILIAVALFAALSYAITNSSRGSSSTDKEQAEIQAGEILNYFAAVQNEFNRLRVINGIPAYNINFSNDNTHLSLSTGTGTGTSSGPYGNNPNCTAPIADCSIFKERGGNLISRAFYDTAITPIPDSNGHAVPGEFRVYNNFIEDVGSNSEPELLMVITGLKDEVCDALNRKLDLPLASSQPDVNSIAIGVREYYNKASNYAARLPGAATGYIGQNAFCAKILHGYYGNLFYYAVHIE